MPPDLHWTKSTNSGAALTSSVTPHPLILYFHLYYTLLVKGSVEQLTNAEAVEDVVLKLL